MSAPVDGPGNGKADLIIRNARLIDGTGGPSYSGDIAIRDDRIVGLGALGGMSGGTEIDAQGKAVAPGFIDVHTHDDRAVLANPTMKNKVSQGVTTVVTGNCGVSLAPLKIDRRPPAPLDLICDTPEGFYGDFASYLKALDDAPAAVNVLAQVGHSSLRVGAVADLTRAASSSEIKVMRKKLEESLEAGAIGFSTGLFYPPSQAAPTEEVIELGKALHDHAGLHTTHMRDEAAHITDSLAETFRIGREADIPVVISHHKCAGADNHGRSVETLPLIDAAMKQQRIGLDVYPYIASSTMLSPDRMAGASRVLVTWSVPHPEHAGRDLADIAAEMGLSQTEAAGKLLPAGAVYFSMAEEDVQRIMKYPHSMIGSDGLPHDTRPHPRLWGTFPRVLGHYSRDVGLFPLEEAVRKMTGLSATQFGLKDRGTLKVGNYADIVMFDPDTVIDTASFTDPMQAATGIALVIVNGRPVWQEGAVTGARPGRAIRRQQLGTFGKAA